MKSLVIKTLN